MKSTLCRDTEGETQRTRGAVGSWALELGARLIEEVGVPVAIINGAVGGTAIIAHLRNETEPDDTSTIYGRMLFRAEASGLREHARAIFWYQGESDGPNAIYYGRRFDQLMDAWREDFPKLEKVYRKLNKNLGGIRTMTKLPGALVIIDSTKEDIAILEALKLKIPIVAIVDTNGDPENITYPIPGNDDAVRAIELFTSKIAEAIIDGKKARIDKELQEEAEEDVSDDAVKLEAVADEPEETVEAVEATEVSEEPEPSADTAEEENVVEETAHEEPIPENDEKQE